MPSSIPSIPRDRSIGEFLCHHPNRPPIEDIDNPSLLDVKQGAALRALLSLRRLGKPIGDDFVAALDAEPRLAALAYRWACHDAHRRHRGRGRDGTSRLIRSWGDVILTAPHASLRDAEEPPRPNLPDPAQDALLQAIEDDHPGQLVQLWDLGIPGLTLDQTHRVILLMRLVQMLKETGVTRIPDPIHQRLWRLRRETGLPLDTTLL